MPVNLAPVAPTEAIAALEARGRRLDPSFHWQEVYAEIHGRAFTVAKSAGFDILADVYAGLESALKDGKTFRQFADELTPLLQAKGWWGRQQAIDPLTGQPISVQLGSPRRLRLIFDVNMRVSYAAGHWSSFERNRSTRPYLRYVALMDEQTRPTHALHHNLVLPIDHPHWRLWSPPCGWNCRCTLQSLSQRDVDRMRPMLKFEPPTINALPWQNKVTGETRFIPEGIDPGWDYNPGRAGHQGAINAGFAAKIATAPIELRRVAIQERLASNDFARFVSEPFGDFAVGELASDIAGAIGANEGVSVVALSADSMLKQKRAHPELTLGNYRALQELLAGATVIIQDRQRSVLLLRETADGWQVAVVKATSSGQGLFLASYRLQSRVEIARLLAREGAKLLVDRR